MKLCRVFPLAVLVIVSLPSCRSTPSGEGRATEMPAAAGDGRILLTPEEAKINGIQSVEVVEREISPNIVVTARVRTRAGGQAEVFSPFPGRLAGEQPWPRIGDSVVRGQHLGDVEQQFPASEQLQLETTTIELQSAIEEAQQEVDLKQTALDRAQQLYDGGAIALKQLQTAQFELKQAETKLEGARLSKQHVDAAQSSLNAQPRRASILAPILGTVIAADAALGQQLDPAKSLLTIADLDTVWVEAAVHERDLPRVRRVTKAEIVIPGVQDESFTGTLVTIGNFVDPQNRTVPAIFSVHNRGGLLKIEMFVEAHIPTGPPVKALVIPSSAVLSNAGADSVYLESGAGIYRREVVELGSRQNGMVSVTRGLKAGEKVVSIGAQSLLSESRKSEIPVEEEEKEENNR